MKYVCKSFSTNRKTTDKTILYMAAWSTFNRNFDTVV